MNKRNASRMLAGLVFLILLAAVLYQIPFIHDRLAWRVNNARAQIKYALSPPEEEIFIPGDYEGQIEAIVSATLKALTPTAAPTQTPTPNPQITPSLTPSPTLEPTPLPTQVLLPGIQHEYQKWNNCGPANLSMSLSYWNWDGSQLTTAPYLKPNPRDKNVMPYEMVEFVNQETELRALTRIGGTQDLLKRLLAAGYPVILETGFEDPRENTDFEGWMGHYEVVNAYDDQEEKFYIQDSFLGPKISSTYTNLQDRWRAFNYTWILTYPPEKEEEVMDLLGPFQDPDYAHRQAAEIASQEIFTQSGRSKFFAWFNRGSSLVALDDYAGAAAAYDQAFGIYAQLDEEERPWRMMWYQTGPYWAYYYTGRHYDVLDLATKTINASFEPAIEESYYWRARSKEALGDISGAISDLQEALKWNEHFSAADFHLNRLLNQ